MSLLESLIILSEKAANIARICRKDEHLFQLLVEEKKSTEANPRFVQDFKTLADVLIQETVGYELGSKFPDLNGYVFGEENNKFSNKLNESVIVEVKAPVEATVNLLEKVLNGDYQAAVTLANEVHKQLLISNVNIDKDPPEDSDIDYSCFGVWIDPIDSTAEYISGKELVGSNGLFISGLRCVTVLLGIFDRLTGIPLMGIVNQPFYERVDGVWRGKCYWGTKIFSPLTSLSCSPPATHTICLSASEDSEIKERLKSAGFQLEEAAGAGYKLLCVITGVADAYVITKNSTYRWDTCAPHAILNCLGGRVVILKEALKGRWVEVNYKKFQAKNQISTCCNMGGVLAYRDENIARKIIKLLKNE